MKTRRFGRTGWQVSELVFGGGFVGGLLIHQDDDTKLAAVRRALDAGINFIDTAPSYGQGRSEQALGWLLKEVPQQPYLATKVEIDPRRLDDVPGQIEASVAASLQRLQRDSVDLLQLHNRIEPESVERGLTPATILGAGGVADSLDRLREQGLCRHIGLTALGTAASCCEVIDSGRFDAAQVYYNLLNPSAGRPPRADWSSHDFGGVIAACSTADVAVMNIRVFAAGVIATDRRHGREIPVSDRIVLADEERRAREVFTALGDGYGSRAQTAVRFALANPDIACVVVGLAELDHLEQALDAAGMGPLPDDALRRLAALHDSDFGRL